MLNSKNINIAILPGDGIGLEVTKAIEPIFAALNLPVSYQFGDIGWSCWTKEADPIPARTWKLIHNSDAVLLGATTSKPEREAQAQLQTKSKDVKYISPIIQLRQKLDLFANVRPCFATQKDKAFDLCIIRENTEGLYAGFDYENLPQELVFLLLQNPYWAAKLKEPIACTLRLQSQAGLQRIFQFAFDYAQKNNYRHVTLADKPNVLRQSSKLSRKIFEEIAANYPAIKADILNVDAVGMHLVTKPELFGVIVTENMFGDILSDVAGGVMGGLGLAPSANIGVRYAYFEPVHGSGIHMSSNSANPSAMFFSLSMLLLYFGYTDFARIIREAVINVIQQGKQVTYDLGGSASTHDMAQAIIAMAQNLQNRLGKGNR